MSSALDFPAASDRSTAFALDDDVLGALAATSSAGAADDRVPGRAGIERVPADETPTDLRTVGAVPADLLARKSDSLRRRLGRWKHRLAVRAAVPLHRAFGNRVDGAFGILMYHRVTPEVPGLPAPTYNVPPQRFHEQLSGLLARGYIAWPLRMVVEAARRGRPVPREVFVVTFDDGYENNILHAWPILRDLGVPATLFVATAYLDSPEPFPFDDWAGRGNPTAPESWRPLTSAQCRQMHASGLIELASHTHTHADFRDRPDALRQDLHTSLECLRSRFHIADSTFAFPYGTRRDGFSGPMLAAACRDAGLLCSLTTEEELARPDDDPFGWGRFTAEADDTSATLAAKLGGWYSLMRGAWRTMRHPLDVARRRPRVVTAATLPGRNR